MATQNDTNTPKCRDCGAVAIAARYTRTLDACERHSSADDRKYTAARLHTPAYRLPAEDVNCPECQHFADLHSEAYGCFASDCPCLLTESAIMAKQ